MAIASIIGITGGTNVGKSTIATCLIKHSQTEVVLFDADKILQTLYSSNPDVISRIHTLYPEAIIDGKVNKKVLAGFYFSSDKNSDAVNEASIEEIKQAARALIDDNQGKLVIFDMPMLIELSINKYCDHVLLITAPYEHRKERAKARMAEELFEEIVRKQSGLSKQERDNLTAAKCADIGDQNKRDALENYTEIKNSNDRSIDDLCSEVTELLSKLS